ncbi:DNA polymerase III subunit gamma/tau [Roseiterribacter gracilis]|uniref:DNA polymerase III subunit gamma/tau n=1 Tax=Roseiterribacter gracilis TaxID=2812848 RepID=A0A8S8XC12_9PROT|nr:DNA polymerase III subunit gamma/tau [Rhodospirillales bacterium TMPK1]
MSLDLGAGATPSSATEENAKAYRVLARKYRPSTFAELIGQDALVRTLTNAFAQNRIAHAFMLTGVRGVGKTTTARIVARALNCIGPDGTGGPTIQPCGVCEPCRAIAADRHVDVIEMDAASRTGVDDVRELIDGVRYAPASARYKVYIVDEVHMLSKQAFNALLKTLEEPPPHVKFVFATTEIRKVPVTVLSRCQRFDLRRVDGSVLTKHFAGIAQQENAEIDSEALDLIARAADGSVRDGLSLLDQAISRGAGKVDVAQVRDMLGLADRAIVIDLFEATMRGDAQAALDISQSLHAAGADPSVVLQDLLEFTHLLTRLKLTPGTAGAGLGESERVRGGALADKLSMPILTRAWQLLLKGLGEVQQAPTPQAAFEMVLLRLVFAADLPTPGDLVRQLTEQNAGNAPAPRGNGGGGGVVLGGGATAVARAEPLAQPMLSAEPQAYAAEPQALEKMPADWRAAVELFAKYRQGQLNYHLATNAKLVRFEAGRIELNVLPAAPRDLASRVGSMLSEWTGTRWMVTISSAPGEASLSEQDAAKESAALQEAKVHPTVAKLLATFPGAKIVEIRDLAAEANQDTATTTPTDEDPEQSE